MNRPQAGRQRAKLYAFDAAAFDEGNRVLKIIVRVLRAVWSKVSACGQRLAVNRFDDAEFVRADLDQRNFTHHALERPLDQMKARLQDISLNADLTFSCDHSSGRHLRAEIAPLLNRNL